MTQNQVERRGPRHPAVMTESARERVARSVPAETQRAYSGDLKRFAFWFAGELGIDVAPPSPKEPAGRYLVYLAEEGVSVLPTAPETLASYVAHLADAGKAPSTIDRALAAILKTNKLGGYSPPDTQAARAVLHTAQHDAAVAGRRVDKASAMTVKALRAMVATCDPSTLIGVRDRAVLVLGFALGARRSELASLDRSDVDEVDEGLVANIRVSKTGAGREVAIPFGSRMEICPVRTLRAWTDTARITDGPLFLRIDRHGNVGRVPTGRGDVDGRLTGQAVAQIVNRAAHRAGLSGDWSGHSLRRGFATEARRAGHDLIAIGKHGGWQDGSRALLGYFEEVDRWTENPLVGVL